MKPSQAPQVLDEVKYFLSHLEQDKFKVETKQIEHITLIKIISRKNLIEKQLLRNLIEYTDQQHLELDIRFYTDYTDNIHTVSIDIY